MLKYHSDHHKIWDYYLDTKSIIKKRFFFSPSIRISGKSASFGDKEI